MALRRRIFMRTRNLNPTPLAVSSTLYSYPYYLLSKISYLLSLISYFLSLIFVTLISARKTIH